MAAGRGKNVAPLDLNKYSYVWKHTYSRPSTQNDANETIHYALENYISNAGTSDLAGNIVPKGTVNCFLGSSSYPFYRAYIDRVTGGTFEGDYLSIQKSSSNPYVILYHDTSNNNYGGKISIYNSSNAETRLYGNDKMTSSTTYASILFPAQSGTLQVSSSDIRLKANIKDTEINGLDFINKIKIRQFDWKNKNYHQPIGFVADELEELDSNLSIGGSDNLDDNGLPIDPKCVNTFYLQGYEVKAIQELSQENKELKETIAELKTQIAEIKELLNK